MLGSGQYGDIHMLCKRRGAPAASRCNYVVKVQEDAEVSEHEANIMRRLQVDGIGPRLEDAFECDGRGFIIMERLDGTLESLLEDLGLDIVPDDWQRQIVALVSKMHDVESVLHNDLHGNNIMYQQTGQAARPYRFYFVDFGLATVVDEHMPLSTLVEPYSRYDNDDFLHWRSMMMSNLMRQDMWTAGMNVIWCYSPEPQTAVLRQWPFIVGRNADLMWPPRLIVPSAVDGSCVYDVWGLEVRTAQGTAYITFTHPWPSATRPHMQHYTVGPELDFLFRRVNQWVVFDDNLARTLGMPSRYMRIKSIELAANARTTLQMGAEATERLTLPTGPASAVTVPALMQAALPP
jgi:hypothetical protein